MEKQLSSLSFSSVGSCISCLLFAPSDPLSTHPLPAREAGAYGHYQHTLMPPASGWDRLVESISRTWRWRTRRKVQVFTTPVCALPVQEGYLHPTSHGWPFSCSYSLGAPELPFWDSSSQRWYPLQYPLLDTAKFQNSKFKSKNSSKPGVLQCMISSKRESHTRKRQIQDLNVD